MEKHWKAIISRSVCDYFFDAQKKALNGIPSPVIATPHHYLISIRRCNVFFVAVCMSEGGQSKHSYGINSTPQIAYRVDVCPKGNLPYMRIYPTNNTNSLGVWLIE